MQSTCNMALKAFLLMQVNVMMRVMRFKVYFSLSITSEPWTGTAKTHEIRENMRGRRQMTEIIIKAA